LSNDQIRERDERVQLLPYDGQHQRLGQLPQRGWLHQQECWSYMQLLFRSLTSSSFTCLALFDLLE
jgi:hypothetical protein